MTTITFASTGWMLDASCAGVPDFTELDLADQRPVCAKCPVQEACLSYALEQDLPNPTYTTTYAGLSSAQIVKVKRGLSIEPKQRFTRSNIVRRGQHSLRCLICGNEFGAETSRAKYCSRACGYRAYRDNLNRRAAEALAQHRAAS